MTKKNIILIDYENLYNSGATNHRLKMTAKGFESIVSHYTDKYDVENNMVFVACHFEGYDGLAGLVEELSYTPIRTLELGDNMSDGYLLAYGMKEIMENKDSIEKVILIAGDGIYTGLVRLASSLFEKVIVVSWEKSLSGHLTKVNRRKVEVQKIEDVFNLSEREAEGWFDSYALSGDEKEVIDFLSKIKGANGFQLIALIKLIQKQWTNSIVYKNCEGDFDKIKAFLEGCTVGNGFLTKHRAPSPSGDREVWWVKLDHSHIKVKAATNK